MRSRKTRLFTTAILLTGMMTLLSSCPIASIVFVGFNDPALEAIVKNKLGLRLTPVTSADMLGLISLDISGLGVTDLTGLGYALNLRFLDASNNPISSLIPIVTCVSLRTLNLEDTDVFEISPLTGLTLLSNVNLCGDAVPDISPLIANTGFGAGDFVTVDCELIFGATPDTQRAMLATNLVTVFLCGDCNAGTSTDPVISVSGSLAFGSISVATSRSITIQNTGGGTLTWGITEASARPAWVTAVGPPTAGSLAAGASDVVQVTVDPTLTSGAQTHTLTIVSNGGTDVAVVITVTAP